jgi:hypothetical protein
VSDFQDDYVAGDINQIDDASDDAREDNVERAETGARVLEYVARQMADEPDAVSVEIDDQGRRVVYSLNVAPSDMGRVIGRRGRTAQALRTLVAAAGARDGVATSVDIVD